MTEQNQTTIMLKDAYGRMANGSPRLYIIADACAQVTDADFGRTGVAETAAENTAAVLGRVLSMLAQKGVISAAEVCAILGSRYEVHVGGPT